MDTPASAGELPDDMTIVDEQPDKSLARQRLLRRSPRPGIEASGTLAIAGSATRSQRQRIEAMSVVALDAACWEFIGETRCDAVNLR
jgi:hypothetical protein